MSSDVGNYFQDKCVFLTGATGFMGTAVVEKLLRSCEGIKKIYVLLRPRSGCDRLQELISSQAFDFIRANNPDALKKIIPVFGDLSSDDLQIEDQQLRKTLQEEVTAVFHLAANIKFNETLKKAIESNVCGTAHLLEFCRKINNIQVIVHVSTAYTNCDKTEAEEKIYKFPFSVRQFINNISDDSNYLETTRSFTRLPNTYNFSKALTEQLIDEEFTDLPIVIVRPATILGAYREPIPGWLTFGLGSISGVFAGVCKGLLRTLRADNDKIIDLVPVDFTVNACIAAAWYYATCRPGKTLIYHVGTSDLNPITWEKLQELLTPLGHRDPPSELAWYPGYSVRGSDFMYTLDNYVYHYLPACIIDFFRISMGKKPYMVRLYKKVDRLIEVVGFYTKNQTIFYTDNLVKLHESLNEQDQKEFNLDIKSLDWKAYSEAYYHGLRTYVLRDDPSTIPAARIVYKRMRVLQLLTRFFIVCAVSFVVNFLFMGFSTKNSIA